MTTIKPDFKQNFIAQYNAAYKAKLSREQFAEILQIKAASIRRRRLAIFKETGLNLPQLESSLVPLAQDKLDRYNALLQASTSDNYPSNKVTLNKKIYVVTSAQNATPIHAEFFSSLLHYCSVRGAQLIVIPYRYKNPTSIWSEHNIGDEWWDSSLTPFLVSEDVKLANSLRIMGHIKIQPTAEKPTNGLDGYTGLDSAILAHPKVQMKTIATPSKTLPKIIMTTGAVTLPNYTDSKAGHKAAFHHSLAAVVVELTDTEFHLRHIHADEVTGHFYDLDTYYETNTSSKYGRLPAIVTGDTHAEFIDEGVLRATYASEDSIINTLNPETLILHDVEDFYRRNHHHINNNILSYGKHHGTRNNVEEGLQITADFIDSVSRPDMQIVIVKSNHDEAFDRWLLNAIPNLDPENSRFYHYMKYHQLKNLKETSVGYSTIDAFEFWCKNPDQHRGLKNVDTTHFLARDESFVINDIELGFHGDQGVNGARGNINQFSKIGPRAIIGHSHSPGIVDGVYQVGTSSKLKLEYNTGCSGWLHTHALVYPDGKRTLINIINGKWKL